MIGGGRNLQALFVCGPALPRVCSAKDLGVWI